MNTHRSTRWLPTLGAVAVALTMTFVASPASAQDRAPPITPDDSTIASAVPGVRVVDTPTAVEDIDASALGPQKNCSAVSKDGVQTCVEITDSVTLADRADVQPLEVLPIPQWCLDNGADGITYIIRTSACRISSAIFTVRRTVDGVTTITGLMNFNIYQYMYTARDSNQWANQITISPWSMTGEAIGTQVQGLSACTGNACGFISSSFPVSTLTAVGVERSGESYWQWPVVPGGQGTANPSWNLQFKSPAATTWTPLQASNAADIRCDNAVPGRTDSGCVLPFAEQELVWTGSNYPTYGAHLIAADASGLPGSRDSGVPLHRLIDPFLQGENRNTSCPQSLPRPTGMSCDEYPFASTHEGAFTGGGTGRTFAWCNITAYPTGITGPTGFSACMINETENSSAGAVLGSVLYTPYRYLDGDGFFVGIS